MFFVCMFLASPFFQRPVRNPYILAAVRWDQARTVPNSLVSEKGAALIASIKVWIWVKFRVFPRFIYIKNEGLGGDMLNTIGSTGVT